MNSSFPKSEFTVRISIFSLTMLGVFMRKTNDGIFVLVNEKPYTTEVRFLSKENYDNLPELVPGCKVEFEERTLKLTEYPDCTSCQLPLTHGQVNHRIISRYLHYNSYIPKIFYKFLCLFNF